MVILQAKIKKNHYKPYDSFVNIFFLLSLIQKQFKLCIFKQDVKGNAKTLYI